ncbi:MAG: hypothetical protein ACKVWV_04020 [Planctomycetota bacterium]
MSPFTEVSMIEQLTSVPSGSLLPPSEQVWMNITPPEPAPPEPSLLLLPEQAENNAASVSVAAAMLGPITFMDIRGCTFCWRS